MNSPSDALPVTCVAPADAQAYCAWQGAALPSAEEWLLAARGPAVHSYAWGDDAPTCNHHWLADADLVNSGQCCGADCLLPSSVSPGAHAKGVSPSGLVDVLTTSGELLRADKDSKVAPCSAGELGCVVRSRKAGEIDAFTPIWQAGLKSNSAAVPVYSFRCVWQGR